MSARYAVVTRAYPREYRAAHVEELVQTANELASGQWSFRHSRSFLFEGLRTRAKLSSAGSAAQVWGNGVAVGLALLFLLAIATPLAHFLKPPGDVTIIWPYSPWLYLIQGLIPFAAMTWTTRWPTAVIVTATSIAVAIGGLETGTTFVPILLATSAAAWWLAVRTDGRRAFSPTVGLLLLAAVAVLALAPGLVGLMVATALVQFGSLTLGLALITIDPRPLIVATTYFVLTSTTSMFSLVGGQAFRIENGIVAAIPVVFAGMTVLLSRFATRRLLTS